MGIPLASFIGLAKSWAMETLVHFITVGLPLVGLTQIPTFGPLNDEEPALSEVRRHKLTTNIGGICG